MCMQCLERGKYLPYFYFIFLFLAMYVFFNSSSALTLKYLYCGETALKLLINLLNVVFAYVPHDEDMTVFSRMAS